LEKTRQMLPQLKKAKVVDAGGLGFYLFFKGMGAAVQDKKTEADKDLAPFDRFPEVLDESLLSCCAEWVFRANGQDKDFFKALLKKHGDSLLTFTPTARRRWKGNWPDTGKSSHARSIRCTKEKNPLWGSPSPCSWIRLSISPN
jgi:hypothetical protein